MSLAEVSAVDVDNASSSSSPTIPVFVLSAGRSPAARGRSQEVQRFEEKQVKKRKVEAPKRVKKAVGGKLKKKKKEEEEDEKLSEDESSREESGEESEAYYQEGEGSK
ncbi:hypothetical protein PR001_g26397 [Phytophthora rubi]|uniref:Uncharacterized protein n=1 Tax=Phytophthora rubi TaxID=129364 RepID=A0A6A3HPN0_9STRA|nr:hypothetical protein PR002_g26774 [Phytophthora rubi]KAE8973162.1 hypothetical protein PR001_g26397 [Phytophthora rubi]